MPARPRRPSARSTAARVAKERTAGGPHPRPRPARADRRAPAAPSLPAPPRCRWRRRAGSTCRCRRPPRPRSRDQLRIASGRADRPERRARHRDPAAHRACTDRTPARFPRPPAGENRGRFHDARSHRAADHGCHDHTAQGVAMSTATGHDDYVLGRTQEEYERLRAQARVWDAGHRPSARPGRARPRRPLPGRRLRPGRDDATDGTARRTGRRGRRRRRRRRARRASGGRAARRRPPPVLVRARRPRAPTSRSQAHPSTWSTPGCCSSTCPTRSPCCGACGTRSRRAAT